MALKIPEREGQLIPAVNLLLAKKTGEEKRIQRL